MLPAFVALIAVTFSLQARVLACPVGLTYGNGDALSGCSIKGPKNVPFADISGTTLTIEGSTFDGFNGVALKVSYSDWIILSNTVFKNFNAQSVTYAIQVITVGELRLVSVKFEDLTRFAPLTSADGSNLAMEMLILFEVSCLNVEHDASNYGLFESAFEYIYGERLNFTNCICHGLFGMKSEKTQSTPVLRDLVTNSITLLGSEGFVFGLGEKIAYFAIEGAVLTNTDNKYATRVGIYMEDVQFINNDGTKRAGIVTNGNLSIIRCSFKGLEWGINLASSNEAFLVCASNFTGCAWGIHYTLHQLDAIDCVFDGYTKSAIYAQNSGTTSESMLKVQGCAFLGDAGMGIEFNGWASVKNTCFKKNGVVIQGIWGTGQLELDTGNCFAASKEVALGGTEFGGLIGVEDGFECSKECTASNVSFDAELCLGYHVNVRPTPQPTRSYRIPGGDESKSATQVPVKPDATIAASPQPTVAASPIPTVAASAVRTVAASPIPTVAASPIVTVAASAIPTIAASPIPTVAASAIPTIAASPRPTVAASPVPTVAASAIRTVAASAIPTIAASPIPTVAASPIATIAASPVPTVSVSPVPTAVASPIPTIAASPERSLVRTGTVPIATVIPPAARRTGGPLTRTVAELDEQQTGGLGAGAAAGIGVGAFVAVAAAALLFLLLKKRKGIVEEPGGLNDTLEEGLDRYISEYGMSDGAMPDDDKDGPGRRQSVDSSGAYREDVEHVSEHNPEDFDDGLLVDD